MIYHNAVEVTRILLYKLNGIFMCGSRWGLGKPLKSHAAVYGGGGGAYKLFMTIFNIYLKF